MNSRNSLAAVFTASLLSACQSPEPAPVNHAAFFSLPPVVERKEGDHSTTKPNAGWAPTDGLEALLLLAETESPQVRQAFHDWQAAHAGIAQATALPDPWVSLSGYLQSVETRTGPMDGKFGLSQKFPWPGKLEGAGNRAAALADSARMAVEDARLQARRDFLRSWTERIYLDHAEGITSAQVALLQHIEDVSIRLYESSRVSQADVLRAQVERLEMSDRLDTLRQREDALVASMEAALGSTMESDATWSGLDLLDERSLPAEDALKRNLLKHSPTLVGLQSRLVAAQVSQHLADLESYPDFSLGADWTMIGEGNPIQRDEGDDALSISLAIELPLQQGRIDSGRRQAMEERRSTVERIQRSRWRLLAALQGAVSAHEDAHRRIDLFQDRLLPLAEMTYQTSLAAYQSGEVGFQEMLDAARVVLDFRLSAARARADAALAYADLNGLLPFALLSSEDQN